MKFINAIYLITNTYKENTLSDQGTVEEIQRKILASLSSVRQSEFYQAQVSGIKPEMVFEIRNFEYKGEDTILYNNKKYKIIRTYNKQDGIIELVCSEKIGNFDG